MKAKFFQMSVAVSLVALPIVSASTASAAVTPAQSCTAAKDKASGKDLQCRTAAYGKAADQAGLDDALAKCGVKAAGTFDKAEDKYPAACPTSEDGAAVDDFAAAVTGQLVAYLSGASGVLGCELLPPDLVFEPKGAERSCIAGKTKAAASALACRMKAHSSFAKKGDSIALGDALADCSMDMGERFDEVEAKYPGACPVENDATLVALFIADQTGPLATYLTGTTPLPECDAPFCGDGAIDDDEDCDGAALGGATCDSVTAGVLELGTLACSSICEFDVAGCSEVPCGNGVIDGGEDCDGSALGGATCDSATAGAFELGVLACNSACEFDTAGCTANPCGNGAIDGGEECDGTNLNGDGKCRDIVGSGWARYVTCDSSCQFDTSTCTAVVGPQVTVTHTQPTPGNPSVPQTTPMTDPEIILLTVANSLDATVTNELDAGHYPGDAPFGFHWVIKSQPDKPDGYSDAGMTGYHTPTLHVAPNALINGEDLTWLELTVASPVTLAQEFLTLPLSVQASTLTLSMYNLCQGQTVACLACTCRIAAALPATEMP